MPLSFETPSRHVDKSVNYYPMEKRVLTPALLDRLAVKATSLAQAQALAAEADSLRGFRKIEDHVVTRQPILRN